MKVFLDTSIVSEIKKGADTGLVYGVTTNPSIIAKSGRKFLEVIKEITEIIDDHISVEVMAEDAAGMVAEAVEYKKLGPQIAIKVPMTVEGLKAVPILEFEKDIRVNVTMVFSAAQACLAMKAGASYVSIVLSRLDAIGTESIQLINDTMLIKENYGFDSEIIAGSVKTQNQLLDCMRAGVDIATIPMSLFEQMYQHPLTASGIEGFKKDWAKVPV
jgi:transaldolase